MKLAWTHGTCYLLSKCTYQPDGIGATLLKHVFMLFFVDAPPSRHSSLKHEEPVCLQ